MNKDRWEQTKTRITANPAHIFKTLKRTGKNAKKTSDKPFAVQILGDKNLSPPRTSQRGVQKTMARNLYVKRRKTYGYRDALARHNQRCKFRQETGLGDHQTSR